MKPMRGRQRRIQRRTQKLGPGGARSLGRLLAVLLLAPWLAGCAAMLDQEGFLNETDFFGDSRPNADLALGALARADYATAERHVAAALKQNPKDPYALLAAGILYQNTGRPARARTAYEDLLALRPAVQVNVQGWARMQPAGVMDIALANLQALEVNASANPWGTGAAPQPLGPGGMPSYSAAPPVEQGTLTAGRPMAEPVTAEGNANVARRFEILKRLVAEDLITDQEYRARRQTNRGALLPLTAPPPAVGLTRPVPTADQVVARLRALRRSFELRAISAREHASERLMILDALLPAEPMVTEPPAAPPQGLMEAAAAVGRLERLRADGLITSDEFARERAAIERAAQGAQSAARSSGSSSVAASSSASSPTSLSGATQPSSGQAGVHLASYKSEQAAMQGWETLRNKLGDASVGLSPTVRPIQLGTKGTYYRLIAGPLPSKQAADQMCERLKAQGMYCASTFM
ncbi:SPOR domain-containing protein [Roseospirillum parvum]|uniref:Short C-terminal domain-containing protein n=1 Tax=Roseospirillum parvum TaxID=83401 RepID=A0A1G7Z4Q7_9PROT|nr:SPOR domain-containing protein [Roseospirillum parvum]SDH03703.1 Short C-terminal domain-containing protein [Roseospirillum parvum]